MSLQRLRRRLFSAVITGIGVQAGAGWAWGAESPDSKLIPAGEIEAVAPREGGRIGYQPGKGITMSTADQAFYLEIRPRVQFLYTFEADGRGKPTKFGHGFQVRRARLVFSGHTFNSDIKYKAEVALSPKDEAFDAAAGHPRETPLLDWYVEFQQLRDLGVLPFSRPLQMRVSAICLHHHFRLFKLFSVGVRG